MFKTRHGEILNRIVQSYPAGLGLVVALEAYVGTVEAQAYSKAKDEVAGTVCLGLHNGPPKGLACAACVQAEAIAPMLATVSAEIEMAKRDK